MDIKRLNSFESEAWEEAFPDLNSIARRRIEVFNQVCCRGCLPKEMIEELAVEAIMRAWRKRQPFKNENHLKGSIAVTARNVASEFGRSKDGWRMRDGKFSSMDAPGGEPVAEKRLDEVETPSSPSAIVGYTDFLTVASGLLTTLSGRDFEIVVDRFVRGLKEKEVAEKYGCGVNNAHNLIQQACGRIREVLLSNEKTRELLRELGFERYLNE